LRISFSLKRSVTTYKAEHFAARALCEVVEEDPAHLSLVYSLLLHLPGRNNNQKWQVRVSALVFWGVFFATHSSAEYGDAACLAFFTYIEKHMCGWRCAALSTQPSSSCTK
jgi:hypothetical protein